ILNKIHDYGYQVELQGKFDISSSFNVSDLSPFVADELDLRTNPFQEGGDDVIMDQLANGDDEDLDKPADEDVLALSKGPLTRSRSRKLTQVIGGLVKRSWKQEECLGRSLINQDTLITIQATSPSS
ncbi:MAG: hypothetical protein J6586_12200, partial [Snodgrassella sp.]|nr:hypothetical protein [Snodgrassella sp.]